VRFFLVKSLRLGMPTLRLRLKFSLDFLVVSGEAEPPWMRSQSETLNEEDEEEAGFEMKSHKPEAISHKP